MIQTDRDPVRSAFLLGFLLGFILGAIIVHVTMTVLSGEQPQDVQDMRAAGVYEYCWRVDAYRQSAGEAVRRGHDDYHGIYDRVCPAAEIDNQGGADMSDQKEYQRGYRAGVKKGKQIPDRMSEYQFYDEAFLRSLPYALECDGWTVAGKQVTTTEQRIDLAHRWAKEAVRKRRISG